MNKKLTVLAFGSAFIGMGIAMPSCPGQQAMQQQIDTLEASRTTQTQRMQAMETRLNQISTEFATAKDLLARTSNAVLQQQEALTRIDAALKAQQAALAAKPKPAAPRATSRALPRSKKRR